VANRNWMADLPNPAQAINDYVTLGTARNRARFGRSMRRHDQPCRRSSFQVPSTVRGTGRPAAGRRAGRGLGGGRAGGDRQGGGPGLGAGGLASFLRRRELGVRLGGPSLPLDVGYAETVPAVLLRDRHCQWAGGCTQPAGACQVHHTTHEVHGGKDVSEGLRLALPLPPPDRHPPVGLDPGRQPGRDHDDVEQEQDEGPHSHGRPARAG